MGGGGGWLEGKILLAKKADIQVEQVALVIPIVCLPNFSFYQLTRLSNSKVNSIQANDFNEYSKNKAERLTERGRRKSAQNIYSLYLVKEVEIYGTIRDA